jgi:methyl-accepting chemotaxis protein
MKIAVVGAGNGGTKLMELFSQMKEVQVACLVDKDNNAMGMSRAKALNIPRENDLMRIPKNVDIIIEATGSSHVLSILKENYQHQARIVESDVAAMMMLLVDRQIEASDQLNHQLLHIQKTGEALHGQMNSIVDVTKELEQINKALVTASEESKNYIEKSHEMIKAVNAITHQIKILGINANIEAARAGEHGRGFSVVATEVQKMSDSTSKFAAQISELLAALNAENESITHEVRRLDGIATSQCDITAEAKLTVDQLRDSV